MKKKSLELLSELRAYVEEKWVPLGDRESAQPLSADWSRRIREVFEEQR